MASPGPIYTDTPTGSIYISSSVPGGVATDNSSIHSGGYLQPLIINDIFKLLAKMVNSLQNVAVQQAQRLQFLSAWQKAYTDRMTTVPTFIGGGQAPSYISALGDDQASSARQDLNSLPYIEQLRSNQSILSDDAKSLQASTNQTTDAVNQQAQMGNSLLQQLDTILSAIYR